MTTQGKQVKTAPPEEARTADLIVAELIKCNITQVVSIPDSKMNELAGAILDEPSINLLRVAKEDEGIGICCGAFFGGTNTALFMANAGLMVTCYPLATLSMFHRIPLFMIISNRGTLGDNAHFQEYQGRLTEKMLDAMGVSHWTIDEPEKAPMISQAFQYTRLYKRPGAILLQGNAFDSTGNFRYLKPGIA